MRKLVIHYEKLPYHSTSHVDKFPRLETSSNICRLLLLSCIPVVLGSIAPTHLYLNHVGPCGLGQNLPIKVSEMSITRNYYDFILSGQMNISSNFSNGWDVQATMQKCPDIRNLDTCDFYRSFAVVSDGCSDDATTGKGFDIYNIFFHYVYPRLTCPISVGNYIIKNYPYFTEDNYLAVAETKISTSVFGYTIRLEGFSEEELIMCVEASLRLLYIRDHNWLVDRDDDDYREGEGKSTTTI